MGGFGEVCEEHGDFVGVGFFGVLACDSLVVEFRVVVVVDSLLISSTASQ